MRPPASTSGQAAKRVASARRRKAAIGSNGLGADEEDFDTFRRMPPMSQARMIADGFNVIIIERLARDMLDTSVRALLSALGLSSSTIARKLAEKGRLSQNESDRVARVLFVWDMAIELFEDPARAAVWLQRPHSELDGRAPIEVLDTQPGYDRVRDILTRAQFGVGV